MSTTAASAASATTRPTATTIGARVRLPAGGGVETSVSDLRTPERGRSSSGSERPSSASGSGSEGASASSLRGLRADGGTVLALWEASFSRTGGGASAPRAVLGATAETGGGSGATEPGAVKSV